MDLGPRLPAPRPIGWSDGARFAVGCLVAPILLIAVPVLASFVSLPLALTPLGKVLYVAASLSLAAWLISAVASAADRRHRFVNSVLVLSVVLALPAFAFAGCSQVLDHFQVVTENVRVASPNGRLVAVDRYIDSGALGGDSQLLVRGRLIPGLVTWQYVIPLDAEPGRVAWVDDCTVTADGREFAIPRVIAASGW